jgi:hypothetical protein
MRCGRWIVRGGGFHQRDRRGGCPVASEDVDARLLLVLLQSRARSAFVCGNKDDAGPLGVLDRLDEDWTHRISDRASRPGIAWWAANEGRERSIHDCN